MFEEDFHDAFYTIPTDILHKALPIMLHIDYRILASNVN